MRKAFEVWARKHRYDLERLGSGLYINCGTRSAWIDYRLARLQGKELQA